VASQSATTFLTVLPQRTTAQLDLHVSRECDHVCTVCACT